MMVSVFDTIENIVGKGEKCWLPAFSPFPVMFLKGFFFGVVKSHDCMTKLSSAVFSYLPFTHSLSLATCAAFA